MDMDMDMDMDIKIKFLRMLAYKLLELRHFNCAPQSPGAQCAR
jgi:hypothetical protein